MLENATNLTIQLEGTVGHWLKTFFSEPYAEPILLAVLTAVTIMIFFVNTKIGKYRRYQQVFDDLLEPDIVMLKYDRNVLGYTPPNHSNLKAFTRLITKRIKRHPFRYRARSLYEKVENAVEAHKNCIASINKKIILVVIDRLKKESFDYMIWNGEGDKPSGDYVDISRIPFSIENIISGSPLKEQLKEDGRYALQCPSTFLKTTSKDKFEKLKKIIQSVADDNDIKTLFTKRDDAKRDVVDALKLYNNKLAVVIDDLRFV